jgi:hypothetical protein
MAEFTTYGVLFGYNTSGSIYTDVAGVVSVEPPKIKNELIDTTNHKSIHKTQMSGGLIEIEDFKATLSFDNTVVSTFYNALISGSRMNYQITYPNATKWQFSGYVKEFQPSGLESDSPEHLEVEMTIGISGSMVIA